MCRHSELGTAQTIVGPRPIFHDADGDGAQFEGLAGADGHKVDGHGRGFHLLLMLARPNNGSKGCTRTGDGDGDEHKDGCEACGWCESCSAVLYDHLSTPVPEISRVDRYNYYFSVEMPTCSVVVPVVVDSRYLPS